MIAGKTDKKQIPCIIQVHVEVRNMECKTRCFLAFSGGEIMGLFSEIYFFEKFHMAASPIVFFDRFIHK